MPIFDGNIKEEEMINALNGKKVSELNNNLRTLIKNLFGVLNEDEQIKCYKVDDSFKTDYVIEYDNSSRNVSMKSGGATIIHSEKLQTFIEFLKEEGISQRTCDTICLFQYGDGTVDGSAPENRKNYMSVYTALEERIKLANEELNDELNFVERAVRRLMFKGSNADNPEADAIYFGDVDYGIVATRRQILKSLVRRRFDFYDNLHIGPILLRPDARYVDKEITDERKRNRIVGYIPNMRSTIEYIAKRFTY